MKIEKLLVVLGIALAMLASSKRAHATPITVSGTVRQYSETSYPVNGSEVGPSSIGGVVPSRLVTIRTQGYRREARTGGLCDSCVASTARVTTATTIANGTYSQTIDPATVDSCSFAPYTTTWYDSIERHWDQMDCPGETKLFSVTVSSAGSETIPAQTQPYTTYPSSISNLNVNHAPHRLSPQGKYWARRVGNGRYPIVIIEGFDPSDAMKSSDLVQFLRGSTVGTSTGVPPSEPEPIGGLWRYALDHDYTIWLFNSGFNGGASIRGAGGTESNGLAYEAMWLVHDIWQKVYNSDPDVKMVVGGYSMGGAVAQAGLRKWCAGSWSASAVGPLPTNCPEVSLWFAGDSPLGGANIPAAIQRYVHDADIAGSSSSAARSRMQMDSPAAHELMMKSINVDTSSTPCNTNCVPSDWDPDIGGCSSKWDSDFTNGCTLTTGYRASFTSWLGNGDVMRLIGGRLPGIALSVGKMPSTNLADRNCRWYSATSWDALPFMINDVDYAGDHYLYPNTAGGSNECDPGSQLDKLSEAVASGPTLLGTWTIHVYGERFPTFVPSWSALLYSTKDTVWNDYWWSASNNEHGKPLPDGAGNFLMAWAGEYLKGRFDRPHCNTSLPSGGKKPMTCRTSVCGDGVCDEGVEHFLNCSADCAP